MELADFGAALPADRPFSCAFDRDDDLSPTQFGIEDTDFGQIQGISIFAGIAFILHCGLGEWKPATVQRWLKDHKI